MAAPAQTCSVPFPFTPSTSFACLPSSEGQTLEVSSCDSSVIVTCYVHRSGLGSPGQTGEGDVSYTPGLSGLQ